MSAYTIPTLDDYKPATSFMRLNKVRKPARVKAGSAATSPALPHLRLVGHHSIITADRKDAALMLRYTRASIAASRYNDEQEPR